MKKKIGIGIFILLFLTIASVAGLQWLASGRVAKEPGAEKLSAAATEKKSPLEAQQNDLKPLTAKGRLSAGAGLTEAIEVPDAAFEETEDAEPAPIEAAIKEGLDKTEYADDRVDYREGFFYQSLTEDVKKRINGKSYPAGCSVPYEELRYLSVLYYDFDGNIQSGELICNKAIARDLTEIFAELFDAKYQIDKIRLIDEYDADDDRSCADNNTSCFCYRMMTGATKSLSRHATGMAIDINPFQNPYVTFPDGKATTLLEETRVYIDRTAGLPHMITEEDLCYRLFKEHGFTWGGAWTSVKDYQHFEK